MSIRVMVVDKHPSARRDLRIFLRSCGDVEFAGEAKNAVEAVTLCGKILPQIILVSLTLAEMSMIPVIRILRHHYPTIQMVILSSVKDESLKEEMLTAGAARYIPRNSSRDHLMDAIRGAATLVN